MPTTQPLHLIFPVNLEYDDPNLIAYQPSLAPGDTTQLAEHRNDLETNWDGNWEERQAGWLGHVEITVTPELLEQISETGLAWFTRWLVTTAYPDIWADATQPIQALMEDPPGIGDPDPDAITQIPDYPTDHVTLINHWRIPYQPPATNDDDDDDDDDWYAEFENDDPNDVNVIDDGFGNTVAWRGQDCPFVFDPNEFNRFILSEDGWPILRNDIDPDDPNPLWFEVRIPNPERIHPVPRDLPNRSRTLGSYLAEGEAAQADQADHPATT